MTTSSVGKTTEDKVVFNNAKYSKVKHNKGITKSILTNKSKSEQNSWEKWINRNEDEMVLKE